MTAPDDTEAAFPVHDEQDLALLHLRLGAWVRARVPSQVDAAKVLTAAVELGTNIVKYAGRGVVRARWVVQGARRGVELEAVDEGPGIADPGQAMRDRFSTSGTLGLGLPGVRRLMDDFHLDSEPGRGTRVKARKWVV
jgi:serine/threonine-protein kinase RsbT